MNRRARLAQGSNEARQIRKTRKKLDRKPMVAKVRLSAELLRTIPLAERTFLVAIGRFANEITALSKLAWWCTKDAEIAIFDGPPRLSQALTLLLLQAGKLYEGWRMMDPHLLSEVHRPLHVREKHSDLLALALEGGS
jgi:hypothetical protein